MRCIWSNYVERESLRHKASSKNVCLPYFYSLLYCYIYNHYCFTHKLRRSRVSRVIQNIFWKISRLTYFLIFSFFFSFSLYNSISWDCPKLTLSCIPYVHKLLTCSTCVLFFVICTKIVNRDRAVVNAVKAKLSSVKNVKFRKCVIDTFFFHVKTSWETLYDRSSSQYPYCRYETRALKILASVHRKFLRHSGLYKLKFAIFICSLCKIRSSLY